MRDHQPCIGHADVEFGAIDLFTAAAEDGKSYTLTMANADDYAKPTRVRIAGGTLRPGSASAQFGSPNSVNAFDGSTRDIVSLAVSITDGEVRLTLPPFSVVSLKL